MLNIHSYNESTIYIVEDKKILNVVSSLITNKSQNYKSTVRRYISTNDLYEFELIVNIEELEYFKNLLECSRDNRLPYSYKKTLHLKIKDMYLSIYGVFPKEISSYDNLDKYNIVLNCDYHQLNTEVPVDLLPLIRDFQIDKIIN